jgi:hypothetical protein
VGSGGSSRTTSRRWIGVIVALSAASLLATAGTGAGDRGRTLQLTFRLDQFLCYSIRPSSGFEPQTVAVLDQFLPNRQETRALKPLSLCNPASKNTGKIHDPVGHLLCYATTVPKALQPRRVAATTSQFGTVRLQILLPTRLDPIKLCLPSGKSIPPAVNAPLPVRPDHFQCYRAKPLRPVAPRTLPTRDQFGAVKHDLKQPVRFCNPASKNGSQIVNKREHLVCYAVAPRVSKPRRVFVRNQFGRLFATATKAVELCLPALKRELSTG